MDAEQRAAEARYILEHKLVREAFEAIESGIVNQLRVCPVRDHDGQHELTLMLQTLTKFRAHLEAHITTGELLKAPTILDSVGARVRALIESRKSS